MRPHREAASLKLAVFRRRVLTAARWVGIALLAVLMSLVAAAFVFDVATSAAHDEPLYDGHSRFVQTGDVRTHYEQWGTSGSPIVLVHGFIENAQVWQPLALRLERGHRVYAIDIRGFGYTERRGPYTLASDTDQLQAFLTALGLDTAHRDVPMLVGHSSGAAIIGNLVLRDPAAASRVVFLDGDGTPYGVGPGWLHRLFVDPFATALIRIGVGNASFARGVYHRTCGPGCPPFDRDVWLRPVRVKGAEGALKAILSRPLIGLTYEQERRITTPAAIIYGEGDDTMSTSDAEATAIRLHTHDVFPIAGARHLPMVSAPDEVASDLEAIGGTH